MYLISFGIIWICMFQIEFALFSIDFIFLPWILCNLWLWILRISSRHSLLTVRLKKWISSLLVSIGCSEYGFQINDNINWFIQLSSKPNSHLSTAFYDRDFASVWCKSKLLPKTQSVVHPQYNPKLCIRLYWHNWSNRRPI